MSLQKNSAGSVPSSTVLLVTNQLQALPSGGRELLCKLNHDALSEIYGDRLVVLELESSPVLGVKAVANSFRGHLDGLTQVTIEKALAIIATENVCKVFVDGSNLGGIVKIAKRERPDLEICTFFHNVEARFFLGALKQTKSARALAVLIVNYLAERMSVTFSDKIICLSERDSSLLRRFYGRGATHISSMALRDQLGETIAPVDAYPREEFALFVGGLFYANQAGISWFVENVVPQIGIKLCIVGKGFEELRSLLERPGKVEVVGRVESLAEWYRDAKFVVAPIFDGSGMKTKVAESLMFGKKVVGSPEAFSGYEPIIERAGWKCSTASEFVSAIALAKAEIDLAFDPQLREIYEQEYSFGAARRRISQALGPLV